MNALFLKKLFVAFIVGFGGVFIPAVLNILDDIHRGAAPNTTTSFYLALVAGGVAAGVRALLALGPINLVPSDKQHSLVGPKS